MGWGRSLWDGASPYWGADSLYGMEALLMGWRHSLWDGGAHYGMERSLWDGVGPYGALTVPMGWGRCLWDGGAHYGMEHSLRDGIGPYGALTVSMGRGRSLWDGGAPDGPRAVCTGRARPCRPRGGVQWRLRAPRAPRGRHRLPSAPPRPLPSSSGPDGRGWRRMAADGARSPSLTMAAACAFLRKRRGKEAEVTSAEAAVLRKAGSCGVDDRAGSSASGGDGRAGSGVKRRAPEVELKGRAPEWRGRQ